MSSGVSGSVYDVAVIGLGVMGLSTAYQSSLRGLRVLGLEQWDSVLHDKGSSHGESRLTRQAYAEGPMYVPLALDAHREWDALGKRVNRTLLHRSGVIYCGHKDDPVIEGALVSAKQYRLQGVEEFDAYEELSKRFPGMKAVPGERGLWEAGAGWLEADVIRKTLFDEAKKNGADLRCGVRFTGWTKLPNGNFRVQTAGKGTFEAKAVVLAAGCWSHKYVPGLVLHPKRRVLHWYEIDEKQLKNRIQGPGFLLQRGPLLLYGFPAVQIEVDGKNKWVLKAAVHYDPLRNADGDSAPDVDPDTVNREVTDQEKRDAEGLMDSLFEGIGKRVKSKVCLYNCSDDGHFVMDTLEPGLVVLAGFSGHGFKLRH